jgi:hypothetical protein
MEASQFSCRRRGAAVCADRATTRCPQREPSRHDCLCAHRWRARYTSDLSPHAPCDGGKIHIVIAQVGLECPAILPNALLSGGLLVIGRAGSQNRIGRLGIGRATEYDPALRVGHKQLSQDPVIAVIPARKRGKPLSQGLSGVEVTRGCTKFLSHPPHLTPNKKTSTPPPLTRRYCTIFHNTSQPPYMNHHIRRSLGERRDAISRHAGGRLERSFFQPTAARTKRRGGSDRQANPVVHAIIRGSAEALFQHRHAYG